jgi:phasin family protein
MQPEKNPIAGIYQTQLEASRRLADVVFSGTERLDRVLIDATHRAVTDQLNLAQAVASARDPNGVASVQATYLSRRPDNAVNYQRELVRIFAEIQNEVGKSMQYYMEQLGSTMSATATNAAWRSTQTQAQAQAGDSAFNPVTDMFSIWEKAFQEVATMANRNMAAARTGLEKMAEATMDAAAVADEGAEEHQERKGHSGGKRSGR